MGSSDAASGYQCYISVLKIITSCNAVKSKYYKQTKEARNDILYFFIIGFLISDLFIYQVFTYPSNKRGTRYYLFSIRTFVCSPK